jgi:hypothetical protein
LDDSLELLFFFGFEVEESGVFEVELVESEEAAFPEAE